MDGPQIIVDGDTTFYNIGNDICILSGMPSKIAILCGHDNNDTIRPIPAATWTVPPQLTPPNSLAAALSFSDSPFRLGTNDQLLIDNDGDPVQFANNLRGAYTCKLKNSQGSDSNITNIGKIILNIKYRLY